ncbi:MAG TPA: hypothetical protein VLU43_07540 [Anaeromyxobacteraceae bacterium]|nr:hypothetical protein [Anaeromyxobacteraceae bacterium]
MPERRPPSMDRARTALPPVAVAGLEGAPPPLPADVLDLVRRAAALPNALEVIERAPLECASVLLRARPADVERVRAALGAPHARAAAAAALARAVVEGARAPAPEPLRRAPRTPDALVREAERTPAGLRILATASPECAAIAFSVHPTLVLEARALLAARGGVRDGGEVAP